MCVCPVLAPHGRPAPPAPATRPSHHQSKPHIHSRRDARAAAHLTSTTSPFCALCRACTLLLASHKRLYQDAPRVRRRFCTTQGAHARTHPHTRSSAQSSAQPVSLPAHTANSTISPRAPHCAPAASRLSALHEARAWHAARTLRHPFSPLSSLPAHSTEHTLPACLHTQQSTQHTAPCARIRLTTQPAPHNNSLPHASPRRPALTPPAARSEKLQRAPLPTPAVSLHSETFSIHPAAAPPRAHSHRSNEDVSRSMGYRPSPRLPHAVPFLFTAISIKRKTRWRKFLSSC